MSEEEHPRERRGQVEKRWDVSSLEAGVASATIKGAGRGEVLEEGPDGIGPGWNPAAYVNQTWPKSNLL